MKTKLVSMMICWLVFQINIYSVLTNKCLYVGDPSATTVSMLNDIGLTVESSTTIPSDLSSYKLVLVGQEGCNPTSANYIEQYVRNGGGVLVDGAASFYFAGNSTNLSNISAWFGASTYSNIGNSYAQIVFDNPLGTDLVTGDTVGFNLSWGGASTQNPLSETIVISTWDYGSGNIHSFIHRYHEGRVSHINSHFTENSDKLYKALCLWASGKNKSLYVGDPSAEIVSMLNEIGLTVEASTTIPSDLSSYKLVLVSQEGCNPTSANYIEQYVRNGGGVLVDGAASFYFAGNSTDLSNISEWFGASTYSNVDHSYAQIVFDNPLGTDLVTGDTVGFNLSWGGASTQNPLSETIVISTWDYGSGNIHSFIHRYHEGRVSHINSHFTEKSDKLYKALCLWASKANSCLYVGDPSATSVSMLNDIGLTVETSTTIPSDLSSYKLVLVGQEGCNPTSANYIEQYVRNGGGVLVDGAASFYFAGNSTDLSNISDWFGASTYSNIDHSYAQILFDNPLGTNLVTGDTVGYNLSWGGASTQNPLSETIVISTWDYGSGNIHSFIHPYFDGRVSHINSHFTENSDKLYKALCLWAIGKTENIPVGLPQSLHSSTTDIKIFPNPAVDDLIYIQIPQASSEKTRIKIIDMNGRVLISKNEVNADFNSVNISSLESGFYLISVESAKEVSVIKMIRK
jgi:uncharacterized membrane protein